MAQRQALPIRFDEFRGLYRSFVKQADLAIFDSLSADFLVKIFTEGNLPIHTVGALVEPEALRAVRDRIAFCLSNLRTNSPFTGSGLGAGSGPSSLAPSSSFTLPLPGTVTTTHIQPAVATVTTPKLPNTYQYHNHAVASPDMGSMQGSAAYPQQQRHVHVSSDENHGIAAAANSGHVVTSEHVFSLVVDRRHEDESADRQRVPIRYLLDECMSVGANDMSIHLTSFTIQEVTSDTDADTTNIQRVQAETEVMNVDIHGELAGNEGSAVTTSASTHIARSDVYSSLPRDLKLIVNQFKTVFTASIPKQPTSGCFAELKYDNSSRQYSIHTRPYLLPITKVPEDLVICLCIPTFGGGTEHFFKLDNSRYFIRMYFEIKAYVRRIIY